MDAVDEHHWTEVQKTEFPDSHNYQPPTGLLPLRSFLSSRNLSRPLNLQVYTPISTCLRWMTEESPLEGDLSELQELQVYETSVSAKGFACGCEFVSVAKKFPQKFGLGITDDNILSDADKFGELFHMSKERVEISVDCLGKVTCVANVAQNYLIHLISISIYGD